MAIGLFKLYSLDDGSFIIVCGKCGYHLIITKEVQERARKNTIIGEIDELKEVKL
jgi:hypothetical protein